MIAAPFWRGCICRRMTGDQSPIHTLGDSTGYVAVHGQHHDLRDYLGEYRHGPSLPASLVARVLHSLAGGLYPGPDRRAANHPRHPASAARRHSALSRGHSGWLHRSLQRTSELRRGRWVPAPAPYCLASGKGLGSLIAIWCCRSNWTTRASCTMLQRCLGLLIPSSITRPSQLMLARIIAFSAVISLLIALYSGIKWARLGNDPLVMGSLVLGLGMIGVVVVLRSGRLSLELVGNLALLFFFSYAMQLVYQLGGLHSAHIFWPVVL